MNSVLPSMLMALSVLFSCTEKHRSNGQKATASELVAPIDSQDGDTLKINLDGSKIKWKGTKLRGTRKHEGIVQIWQAYLLAKDGRITGGKIVVDMRTLTATDIPAYEVEALSNLNGHLTGSDFFDVERYPEAQFQFTKVTYRTNSNLNIAGSLTIKGVTRNIAIGASDKDNALSSTFKFDRFLWGITYEGNIAERTLVDRDVELTVKLKIE